MSYVHIQNFVACVPVLFSSFSLPLIFTILAANISHHRLKFSCLVSNEFLISRSISFPAIHVSEDIKGAMSRQSSSIWFILPITRPQSLWNLK